MKVILLEDVNKVGKKGDVVKLSDAYARNVILAKKQGLEATPENLNNLKLRQKHDEKLAQENLDAARLLAEQLKDKKIEVHMKSGEGGRTFGSVSTKEISEAAKQQLGLDIDKKKMVLKDPIKALGTYEVTVKLHPKVNAVLTVHVSEE